MKNPLSRSRANLAITANIFCTLVFASAVFAQDPTKTADNKIDIAIIDRAIASAKPGEQWVKFGDVGMRISDLKVFRDRLAGKQPEAQPQPRQTKPLADTPPGTAFKWPNGNVFYRFDPTQVSNGTITAVKMQQFRDGVGEWAAFANLHFIEFTGTPPTNYITVQDDSSRTGGFSDSVGMKGGPQLIKIGSTSWNRGTVCHEVGHALGFYHEQQRDDRDTYVTIDWNNIATGNQPNFAKLPGGSAAKGAYDFYSVMHYSRNALAINPTQDTITMKCPNPPTVCYAQFANIIGNVNDRTLSKLDRSGMAAVYGNPSVLPSAVVTNTNDSGPGSMRSAIYYAFDKSTDSQPVPTTVTFHIPTSDPNFNASTGVFTIKPTFLMTAPGDGTTIDGTTQTAFTGNTNPNGPEIVLDGSTQAQYEFAGVFGPAFILRQANCTVKGFVIHGYDNQGIQIKNSVPLGSVATGNVISGCYIGTDAAGSVGVGNGNQWPGIEIFGGANHNTIGGTTAAARNVISGNTGYGISIHDAGCTNNLIEGNYIGTNALGTSALSNNFAGVGIFTGAQKNTIGGTTSGARNVISGNKDVGIQIQSSGTSGNVVLGNYIGLNAAGSAAVGNGFRDPSTHFYLPGVDIFNGAQKNTIGGTAAGSGNVISGNAAQGVAISGSNSNGNLVQGNFIGTNPSGTAAIANGLPETNFEFAGIAIFGGAQSNIVGGTTSAARNVISGNGAQGVFLGDVGTSSNLVEGNFIGTNATGATAISNGFSGVGIFNSASANTIGGTVAGARNVISGNTFQGIAMGGVALGQSIGPKQNVIVGNFIGVNAPGSAALSNGSVGVDIFGSAQSNTIGGTFAGAGNVISGNKFEDVAVSAANTNANVVLGNYIGLDATGVFSISNNNSGVGIFNGAQNNVIGGTAAEARNFISGHAQYGIFISDSGTNGNTVQGNTIGLNVAASAVANGRQGIAFFNGSKSNTIGGNALGASNIISGNTDEGVALFDNTTSKDSVSQNSIFGNHIRGIGVYTGSNNSQASATLSSATLSTSTNPGGTDVSGSLTSTPSTNFRIEFFASPSGDEGQFFVGSTNALTNAVGLATFTTSLPAAVPSGYVITATATDPNGDTSQFSTTRSVTTTDTDGDGIPDNWMIAHFGHPTGQASDHSRATDDADGTGMTNLQKFLAGLDPKNPNSVFRISSIDRSTGNPRISFQALAGKTYRLEYRNDLVSGNWAPLIDGIFSSSTSTVRIVDPGAASASKRFYRFSLEPAQSVATDPVGFTRASVLGKSDTFVSIPFTRPPEFAGAIQSASGNVITVSGTPAWTNNQFVYAAGTQPKHYYALIGPSITTDPKEGHTYAVTANGSNTLTVATTPQNDLTGIPADAQVILIPYWTLATVFPATDANGSFTPTTSSAAYKTQIRIPKDSTPGINFPYMPVYFFSNNVDGTTSNVGWRLVGDNTTNHGDDTLAPDSYFVVRNSNGAPTLNLTSLGAVLLKKFARPLMTQAGSPLDPAKRQDNAVSILRPIDVTLDASGLGPADGSFVANDQLLLFNNTQVAFDKTPSAIYFYDVSVGNTGGWRLTGGGSTNHGSDVIKAGTGFVIRKAATATGQTVFWTNAFP